MPNKLAAKQTANIPEPPKTTGVGAENHRRGGPPQADSVFIPAQNAARGYEACGSEVRDSEVRRRPGTLPWHVDEVAQFVALGLEVAPVVDVGRGHDRDALHDFEAIALEAGTLGGVVRQQANAREAQVEQDLHADAVVAAVGGEAQRLVGLDGVQPVALLEGISLDLVVEADA